MRITIFAAGSRGDIQPCIALGRGLQEAGYRVCLAAPQNFTGFIQQHGVRAWPLRGDVQQIMASDTGREFMGAGGANPLKSIRAIRTLIEPVVMEMAADALAACEEADALICLGVFGAFGQSIAEARRMPLILVEPAPLLPTRAFPAPSWPIQRDLGPLHNYLAGAAMLRVIWLWYHGGAGTTMEGLRAGVPAVIVPFAFDQYFWGARIQALGLGPRPIAQKKLTADRLARAIQTAVTDANMRRRAAACGQSVRAENGIGNAVGVVRQIFGPPTTGEQEP